MFSLMQFFFAFDGVAVEMDAIYGDLTNITQEFLTSLGRFFARL